MSCIRWVERVLLLNPTRSIRRSFPTEWSACSHLYRHRNHVQTLRSGTESQHSGCDAGALFLRASSLGQGIPGCDASLELRWLGRLTRRERVAPLAGFDGSASGGGGDGA